MNKPIVLLDVDGVMTHHNQEFLSDINELFGADYKVDDIVDFDYSFLKDDEREHIYYLWNNCSYDGYSLSEHEQDVLKWLRSVSRVVACSTPFAGHIESKYRFLTRYFKYEDIVLCKDKWLIGGDILVDDKPSNIEKFRTVGKHAIVFDQPWNKEVRGPRAMDFESIGPCVVDYMLERGIHDFGL
jgi:5'(3')-deoxyribonucleotidase